MKWDFLVLVLRWYLAVYMLDYGFTKIFDGQFNIPIEIASKPMSEIDNFYIAWHLFGTNKLFGIVNGIFQIVGAILLIINPTVLFGALLLLPVLFQIFLVDVCFTTNMFGINLPLRLGGMLLSNIVILYYYKDRLAKVFRDLFGTTCKYKYPWYIFILLPFIGFSVDFIFTILTMPIKWLVYGYSPIDLFNNIKNMFH